MTFSHSSSVLCVYWKNGEVSVTSSACVGGKKIFRHVNTVLHISGKSFGLACLRVCLLLYLIWVLYTCLFTYNVAPDTKTLRQISLFFTANNVYWNVELCDDIFIVIQPSGSPSSYDLPSSFVILLCWKWKQSSTSLEKCNITKGIFHMEKVILKNKILMFSFFVNYKKFCVLCSCILM